ncbi:hypothetical protein C8A01DRAFT_32358 [Parachaetomium inaequale]|uniref:Uncharacterized protein n=1 Tax=Parachaetomium inaequale TaxID=2588326 RepID=A0AAN6SUU2_9PEZI|nr:hypothetical protein C8A01DRAFT_32358 [Parachaetomium inaequale]
MASTIDINCPLNTTECIFQAVVALLDQVREKNAEFNWDPLSFGFTAVTGVAAACFAAITIVQALFAAGPGRLKSSRYAIGPWAKFTRHFFDRQEWRFRSLAQTPVIVFSSQDGVGDQHKYFIAESPEFRPAGWNALLSHLRLDKPEFWRRKPTGADHLPQDLSAVPAYGNIAAIITLAIAQAGGHCEMVPDQDSQILMVRGDAFQLRMRKHAVLGTVATFEIYPNPRPPSTKIALIHDCEDDLAREAAIYAHLGDHPQILKCFGLEEHCAGVHSLRWAASGSSLPSILVSRRHCEPGCGWLSTSRRASLTSILGMYSIVT